MFRLLVLMEMQIKAPMGLSFQHLSAGNKFGGGVE